MCVKVISSFLPQQEMQLINTFVQFLILSLAESQPPSPTNFCFAGRLMHNEENGQCKTTGGVKSIERRFLISTSCALTLGFLPWGFSSIPLSFHLPCTPDYFFLTHLLNYFLNKKIWVSPNSQTPDIQRGTHHSPFLSY